MPRLDRLSALDVARKSSPGRYADGGGLYLQIGPTGAKSWLFRYKFDGKPRAMGMGPLHAVSLKNARTKAGECRRQLSDGLDPIKVREAKAENARQEAARSQTFDQCAEAYIMANEAAWTNPKHRQQWRNTLATYASPVIGKLPVQAVDVERVKAVLLQEVDVGTANEPKRLPLWVAKPETAKRVRGRIETVLDWAAASRLRATDNPARWTGLLSNLLPAPSKLHRVRHHPALPFDELRSFLPSLREREGMAALALEFLILTAARTSEVLDAKWDEFDLSERTWTVPAQRMKGRRLHRVPLSRPALAALEKVQNGMREDGFVFPGMKNGRPLSNMALLILLRRMKRGDITAHGFRSTFRDWAAERTAFPRDVVEMALAHTIESKVEAAYRRGDLFEKRRALMDAWAEHCEGRTAYGQLLPFPKIEGSAA